MEDIISQIIDREEIMILLIIFTAVTIMSIVKALTGMIARLAGERTRREVAAYIAEGSMTPEQGEKLLASSKQNNGRSCCG
tara:strand:- start:512 stop:754 length:243 start_codon:yes stop_codon:yes gene_type:complete